MKKTIIFIVTFVLVSLTLQAARSLENRIVHAEGFPLEGALAFIPELNRSCVTDAAGHYRIQNPPARSLAVHFSYLGCAHQLKKVLISKESNVLDVENRGA